MSAGEILHRLSEKSPGQRWAFVIHEARLYFARDRGDKVAASSPVVKLLQGIFEEHRDLSFFILRKRLYLSYEPGPMDRGFIDLVAKRFSVVGSESRESLLSLSQEFSELERVELGDVDSPYLPLQDRTQNLSFATQHIQGPQQALEALSELEKQIPRGPVLHDHARPIGAFLTDEAGRVLGHAVHGGAVNKTLHAEIILLQNYLMGSNGAGAETGLRLYVSLSPCRMCAGAWVECFGDRLKVFYRDEDPGSKARLTALTKRAQQEPLLLP